MIINVKEGSTFEEDLANDVIEIVTVFLARLYGNRTWLLAQPRFEFHFAPTYSSWMNQVERWFSARATKLSTTKCPPWCK